MDVSVQTLPRKFRTEVKCIQRLMKNMLDLKYVTILDKRKMKGNYHNSQQRVGKMFKYSL